MSASTSSTFVMPLRAQFSPARASASADTSSAIDGVGAAREMQRERAVIAEAVERASACEFADEHAILALVEKRAGLLAAPRRGEKADAVLVDLDLVGDVAAEQLDADGQLFLRAQRDVVARENAGGSHDRLERVDDRVRGTLRVRRS